MCPVLDFIVMVKLEPEVREKDMRLCWGLERRQKPWWDSECLRLILGQP